MSHKTCDQTSVYILLNSIDVLIDFPNYLAAHFAERYLTYFSALESCSEKPIVYIGLFLHAGMLWYSAKRDIGESSEPHAAHSNSIDLRSAEFSPPLKIDKKFEQSSRNARKPTCSQVILVYLHPFRRLVIHSFAAKNRPKITLNQYFRVQGHSRLSMLTFVRSFSSVLVMISSMAVPICNHLHARQAQSINHHFLQGYLSLTPTCAALLESRASGLGLLKSTFHAANFTRRLSWSISSHFGAIYSWNGCRSAKLWKKFTKNLFLRGSRSFKVIDVDESKKPVTSACYDKQLVKISMYLSATVFTLFEPITAKWRLFKGVPLFDALVREEPLHPVARNFFTIN